MREIRRDALVPFPAQSMYDLIERVEDYPQFLPWCLGTHLLERSETRVRATVEVGLRDLRVRVTTCNDKRPPDFMAIHMEGGSFRHFYGEWRLRPLGDAGCHVLFMLQYELALRAEAIAGPLIERAADRMVDAFVQRAEVVFDADRSNATRAVTDEAPASGSTRTDFIR
jgi:ribosome-associated toxin RatA of RatAB toxin-antitoxin module